MAGGVQIKAKHLTAGALRPAAAAAECFNLAAVETAFQGYIEAAHDDGKPCGKDHLRRFRIRPDVKLRGRRHISSRGRTAHQDNACNLFLHLRKCTKQEGDIGQRSGGNEGHSLPIRQCHHAGIHIEDSAFGNDIFSRFRQCAVTETVRSVNILRRLHRTYQRTSRAANHRHIIHAKKRRQLQCISCHPVAGLSTRHRGDAKEMQRISAGCRHGEGNGVVNARVAVYPDVYLIIFVIHNSHLLLPL